MGVPHRIARALSVALGALVLLPATAQEDEDYAQNLVGAQLSIERDDQYVEVRQGERLLLRYRYHGASHKPYVDVLTTPRGKNVLRDAPADHLHHHGLMLAWRVDGTNFWEEGEGSGRELHVEWDELRIATTRHVSEPGQMPREQAILRQYLEWVGPSGEPLLAESRELTLRATVADDEPHVLSWHSTFWTPEDSPGVRIEGANYNGLGARFLAAMDEGGHFLNARAARGVQGTAGEQSAWCAYSAPTEGDRRATVAMFGARANPRHPTRWFTMDRPFAYLAATLGLDRRPLELGPDEELSLSYGVAVFTCTICLQRDGAHYGYGRPDRGQVLEPVLFVPYPWCRSLTGLVFANAEVPFGPFQGQGLAADYNTRRIIRWTDQAAGAGRQGACYPFLDGLDAGPTQMVFGPDGALYVGFMSDGSWYPERARGGVYRVVPEGRAGLAVLRAESTPTGFVVEFTKPVDPASIGPGTCDRAHRYFHQYEGRYHSEEIAHEDVPVQELTLSPDGRTLTLTTGRHVTPRIVALQLRGVCAVTGETLEGGEVYLTVHTQPDR